ncbi:MAG: Fe-S-containing hydro-lyase [Lachnospiraceae bacterium]|nr:Fe-S-containing hydro-lyase [Lachnospiraceae bacterium]
MKHNITTPLTEEVVKQLKAGDTVSITGVIYSARDAAHKRMIEALERGEELPLPIEGAILYYLGPTPAPEGRAIGSAGPTTASRMDKYTPQLLKLGLKGMVAKGRRSQAVKDAIRENNAVYMAAIGGAGALLSKCIKEAEVIAYDDLGPEAIRKMRVEDFPAVVIADCEGNDLYETAAAEYEIKD